MPALALSTLFAQLSRYIPLSLSCQRVDQPTLHTGIGNINIALSSLLSRIKVVQDYSGWASYMGAGAVLCCLASALAGIITINVS